MRLRSIRRRVGTGMVLLILLFGLIAVQAIVSITSFGRLVEAVAINEEGQILVEAMVGGDANSFVLTPIPEPATLSLLTLGGLAMLRRRRT